MAGVNKVLLLGELSDPPDVREKVTRLRICVTESRQTDRGVEDFREWMTIVCFGKQAEAVKLLAKGDTVHVEGRLSSSSYEKDGQKVHKTEVVAFNVLVVRMASQDRTESTKAAFARGPTKGAA